ncbi:serine hydrolase [Flavobacterium sp. J27]|uniref:serine hydrolase n=1 Tax=Flavobacterium sp. J27 TaxID=2060419 RepID=UPI00102F9DE8|nr:serine hydrolase [Flavobacterium sp. J27]
MKKLIIIFAIIVFSYCTPKKENRNPTDKITEIENYLEALNKKEIFSGAVLIAKNDSVIFQKAYGYANLNHKIPNSLNTKFNIASMGKMFTGVAIMQLVQEGILSVNDKVGKFLPEYPNNLVRDSVSIHQLLTHTSGLPDFMTPEYYESSKDKYRKLTDFSRLYQSKELAYPSGTRFVYCNSDYLVLGLIIEKVTGLTFDQYLEKNIYGKAVMTNTGNYMRDHVIENMAVGYTHSNIYPEKLMNNIYVSTVSGGPAGGEYSTLNDIFNFSKGIKNNLFLNPYNTEILITGKVDDNTYAYGFTDIKTNNHRIIGHSGGHLGVACELRMFEDIGYTVIILTNRDAEDGFLDARYFIQKQLTGSTPSIESYYNTKSIVESILKKQDSLKQEVILKNHNLREDMINVEGYHQLSIGNYDIAITLFKLATTEFPESSNAFDSLGEAYMVSGDTLKAIKAYEKSLYLDTLNINATEKLRVLKTK